MQFGSTALSALAASPLRLSPVSANQQLVFWVQIATLLLLAVGLGRLASRLGQPPVIGQLLAGVVLGPTVFGTLWPTGFQWFLPKGELVQSSLLLAISTLSLAVVLLSVGFETDITLLRRLGRPAAWVAAGSLVLPLGAGVVVGLLLPASVRGPAGGPISFSLLVGVALGASSLPVIAEIVGHMGAIRRDFGQITLAAGTVNDSIAFVLIALAVALAGQGAVSQLARVVIGLLVLGALAAIFAQPLVDRLLRVARRGGPERGAPNSHPSLAICLVVAMVAAALVQLVGIEGALGAFVAGVVLARSRFGDAETFRFLSQLSSAFFAPLYFGTAGLEANLVLLRHPETALVFGSLVVVGGATKFAGSYLGAVLGRLPKLERVALGVALNGRGTVQVIAGTVGLSAGIIGSGTYTAIVAMSLVTSLATPPLLRKVVRRWEGSPSERQRLDREARLASHLMVTQERVLVVTDQEVSGAAGLRLADLAWPVEAQFTVLACDGALDLGDRGLEFTQTRAVEWRRIDRSELLETVRSELKLGCGAVVVGAEYRPDGSEVPSTLLQDLLPVAPVPLVIMLGRGDAELPAESSSAPRLLVPVSGASASRAALEVAYSFAERTGSAVQLLHVDTAPKGWRGLRPGRLVYRRLRPQRARRAADALLTQALAMSATYHVTATANVQRHSDYDQGLLEAATGKDMVILGVRLVETENGAYLGAAAEALLERAAGPVVLVSLPN